MGPDDDFPSDRRNGRRRYRSSWCRGCYRAYNRSRTKDSAKKKEYQDRYYIRHHGAIRDRQKNLRLKSRYGITELDYEAMVVRQAHCCLICERRFEKLHVDHHHATGEVRGLLCGNCNRRLGFLENRVWVEAANAYLAGVQ